MVRVGQFVAPAGLPAEAFLFSRTQCFHLHVTVNAEMDRVPFGLARPCLLRRERAGSLLLSRESRSGARPSWDAGMAWPPDWPRDRLSLESAVLTGFSR
jgi:hypothetical protein